MNGEVSACLGATDIIRLGGAELEGFVAQAVKGAEGAEEKVKALFLAVRDGIVYDPFVASFSPENYYPENIIKAGRGYCVMKAVLLCAALRKAGIPARLGFADLRIHTTTKEMREMLGCDIFAWHGFTEVFLDGEWRKATPSFHADLCRKRNISPLVFDAKSHSIFPPLDLSGKPFASYIRYIGSFTDLPLDLIMKGWRKVYTDERVDMWMDVFRAGANPPSP